MKICVILICTMFIIVVAEKTLENDWSLFKKTFHRTYKAAEDKKRHSIWKKNVGKILEHNKKFPKNKLKANDMADWTPDEIKFMKFGYQAKLKASNATKKYTFSSEKNEPPDYINWRYHVSGVVNPVRNQGSCGSCWAFAAAGAIEGQLAIKLKIKVILSPQNLVDCDKNSRGCKGGTASNAYNYAMENKGIDTEKSYPYKAKKGKCKFNKRTLGGPVIGYVDIPSGNEKALKYAVAEQGPIAAVIDADTFTFHFMGSGIYNETGCKNSELFLNHEILIVGYGTEDGQDYWLIKNSWGKHWGANGYAKIARNKNNHCGIATEATFPLVHYYHGTLTDV